MKKLKPVKLMQFPSRNSFFSLFSGSNNYKTRFSNYLDTSIMLFHFPIKFFTSIFLISSLLVPALGQNIGINAEGLVPDNSAILDISSNNKGLLIPRISLLDKNDSLTIANPAKGLLVYNINADIPGGDGEGFFYNKGTINKPEWIKLVTSVYMDSYWNLFGNSNIDTTKNFIGTIDNQPLNFRVNSRPSGKLDGLNGNTSFGYSSLESIESGVANTAIGLNALQNTNLGNYNVGIGADALSNNKDGFSNIAIGKNALQKNISLGNIIAIGDSALMNTGDFENIGNPDGNFNTAIGSKALFSNTIGFENTSIGYKTLFNNVDGFSNTAIGPQSLYNNYSGLQNVAIGSYALLENIVGSYNMAIGVRALASNDSSYNTGIGTEALGSNFKGFGNTAIGDFAGYTNTNGNYNTFIGKETSTSNGNTSNNSTAIGYKANFTGSNMVRIGGRGITSIGGPALWSVTSDGRFKKNIKSDVPGLSFIMLLKPVTYEMDEDAIDAMYPETSIRDNPLIWDATAKPTVHTGFIAQEVELAAQSIGYDFIGVDPPKNDNDHYSLRYAAFVMPLTKAVQEQQLIIEDLRAQVLNLQLNQQNLESIIAKIISVKE